MIRLFCFSSVTWEVQHQAQNARLLLVQLYAIIAMVLSTAFLVSTKKVPYLRIIPGSRFRKGAKWIPYLI